MTAPGGWSWATFLSPLPRLPTFSLLHRHALGEVARLVDVAAAGDGGVVGEELERDDAQQRLEALERVGDVDHVVAVAADVRVALGGDGDDVAAAGPHLFDVADH